MTANKDIIRYIMERTHQQQSCITKMLKEGLLIRRKMLSGRNMDIRKGMKNTRNSNYPSKCMTLFLNLFKREMISKIIKLCGVNYIYKSKVIQGPRWKYTMVSFFSFSVLGHTPPHWDLSFPTRDRTHASYNGSVES